MWCMKCCAEIHVCAVVLTSAPIARPSMLVEIWAATSQKKSLQEPGKLLMVRNTELALGSEDDGSLSRGCC